GGGGGAGGRGGGRGRGGGEWGCSPPAWGQRGPPRPPRGPPAKPKIRSRAFFRCYRLPRARPRRNRCKEGFPGQGLAGIRGLSEEPRRRRETGAWRYWLVLAHGGPGVHGRGRRAAQPPRLSRHPPRRGRREWRPPP